MAKIEVRFQPENKTSKAGREYQLIEMWITDRDGSWSERPTISIMPFHARLLLQSLPEFCKAIKEAEELKDGAAPAAESESEVKTDDCPW